MNVKLLGLDQADHHVMNNDLGCRSSSFLVNASAPDGFAVSMPTNSITLNSNSSAYLTA